MGLKVVETLFDANPRQIPAMLRKLADNVENPPVEGVDVNQAVCVIRDSKTGKLNIYGWGDVNADVSIAMLTIAANELAAIQFTGHLWSIDR